MCRLLALLGAFVFASAVLGAAKTAFAAETNTPPIQVRQPPVATRTVPLATIIVPAKYDGDVRNLPALSTPRYYHWRNEFEQPIRHKPVSSELAAPSPLSNLALAPMPAPIANFAGLGFNTNVDGGNAGVGWPPDPNGDVGPTYYIQGVNEAWGIFDKTTGALVAGFTENQLWSLANTGTPCDANGFGDPVVLYDGLADRWILTNFAFELDPFFGIFPLPPFYQCLAVSENSDPVSGGWYLYAVQIDTGDSGAPPAGTLNDYDKFGLWSDCLYLGANGFDTNNYPPPYTGAIFAAFSRAALYSGAALTSSNSSIGFIAADANQNPYSLYPANLLGGAAGAMPPSGRSEFFAEESNDTLGFEVRKFQQGSSVCGAGSSLSSGTTVAETAYAYPADSGGTTTDIVPQKGTTNLVDSLGNRLMQKVQYRNIGGQESLWITHTACGITQSSVGTCASSSAVTQPVWAQIDVTGGTINTTPVQQQIYSPDTTLYRWMSSLAVDGQGDMAIGYSISNGVSYPGIAYSGRLVTDPPNNLSQTETLLVAGAGSQDQSSCGGAQCDRWGDYSAMSVDPNDDCTFWYTNQYYATAADASAGAWDTRIGSFKFPGCTGKANQKITFTSFAPMPAIVGGTAYMVTATGGPSSNPVLFTIDTSATAVCSLSGATVSFIAPGTCVIDANQAGDATYNPAPQAQQSFSVVASVGAPAKLVFVQQPSDGTAGVAMNPAVSIEVHDAQDNVVTSDTQSVTLTVNSGPGTFDPASTVIVAFNSGTATFANLIFDVAGSGYALLASDPGDGLTPVASGTFSIGHGAPLFVFTTQPLNISVGNMQGTVAIAEEDSYGNVISDSTSVVTLTITACGGQVSLGGVTLSNGFGVLTSDQRFYTQASGLTIGASAGSLNGTSASFNVAANPDLVFADGLESCRL